MERRRNPGAMWQATRWERCLLTAMFTALGGELFINVWVDNFRISGAVIIFSVLLVTLMRDSRLPITGAVTGLAVLLVRCTVGYFTAGVPVEVTLVTEFSSALFYLCYDGLFCLQVRDRYQTTLLRLWYQFWLCDIVSNLMDLTLAQMELPGKEKMTTLVMVGLIRSVAVVFILWGMKHYRRLLMEEEHQQRYQRLFLMTASLKNELYFLKKDADNIEGIMTRAYRLYEQLGEKGSSDELRQLALSIARDVHEVKKDNLSIIRGIEDEVVNAYSDESMRLSDLFLILADTMRSILKAEGAKVTLECRCGFDFTTSQHYRLMSILKNLVMNAAEAIQGQGNGGAIWVDEDVRDGWMTIRVQDNGPGISPRARKNLFQVGYSTKFDPETGNINRGIGLPAVAFMVQELKGEIQVLDPPNGGKGACFQVRIPISVLEKGAV